MRRSITWGTIVGVALGATVTFALARGWLDMPWSGSASPSAPAAVGDEASVPGARTGDAPIRPLRPGGLPVGELAARAGLSRS
jgi:hypothetical protein